MVSFKAVSPFKNNLKTISMKKSLIATIVIIGMAKGAFSQNRSIRFQDKSFNEAQELAKKENKLIFIDFYTTWCGPCKKMEKEVFPNNSVADFFNKNFINLRRDAEKGEGIKLATKYEIQVYPTLLFVSADGAMAHQACGFRDPEHFVELGALALDPEKRLAKSYNAYLGGRKDPQFLAELINSMKSACGPVGKITSDYLGGQKEADLFSKANWELFNRNVFDLDSREFKFVRKNQKKFSALYGDSVVNKKISEIYLKKVQDIAKDTAKDKEKEFSDLKAEIRKTNLSQKDLLLARADLNFYNNLSAPNWQKFAEAATSGVIENNGFYWDNPQRLNHFAWTFYEHVDYPIMLQKAVKWIRRSIELKKWPENNDTYANLLFKLGEIEQAIEVETTAFQLAVNANRLDAKDYEETLKKFEEAKK